MPRGTIKNLVSERGFGFILPEEESVNGKELFFHRSDLQGITYAELLVGQPVEYELGQDERRSKPKAFNVRSVSQG